MKNYTVERQEKKGTVTLSSVKSINYFENLLQFIDGNKKGGQAWKLYRM